MSKPADRNALFAWGMAVQLAGIIALAVGIGLHFTILAVLGGAMILGSGAVQLHLLNKWGLSDYTRLPTTAGRREHRLHWGEVLLAAFALGFFIFAVLAWRGVIPYDMYEPRQTVAVALAMSLQGVGALLPKLNYRAAAAVASLIALLSLIWIDG